MTKGKQLNQEDKYFYCRKNLTTSKISKHELTPVDLKENDLFKIQVD